MNFPPIFVIFQGSKLHDHKFFSTCQIDHTSSPSKSIIKNVIFEGLEKCEKVTSDTKNLDIFQDSQAKFLSFRIRVKNLWRCFFHYSKLNLDPFWVIYINLKNDHICNKNVIFSSIFAFKIYTNLDFTCHIYMQILRENQWKSIFFEVFSSYYPYVTRHNNRMFHAY